MDAILFFKVHLYNGPLRHVVFCHQTFTYAYNTINININKSTRLPNQSLSKVVRKMAFSSLFSCSINTFYFYLVPSRLVLVVDPKFTSLCNFSALLFLNKVYCY